MTKLHTILFYLFLPVWIVLSLLAIGVVHSIHASMKKIMKNLVAIPIIPFRLHVLVAWEIPIEEIVKCVKKHGTKEISDEWIRDFKEHTKKSLGLCYEIGGSRDILVFLKKRPQTASEYGVLYHELYHAVDTITESSQLLQYEHSRAFIFEYLANECNGYFWSLPIKNKEKNKKQT